MGRQLNQARYGANDTNPFLSKSVSYRPMNTRQPIIFEQGKQSILNKGTLGIMYVVGSVFTFWINQLLTKSMEEII